MKGRIIKVLGGLYTIKDIDTKEYITAKGSGKLRYMRLDKDSSFNKQTTFKNKQDVKIVKLSPKVGDIVTYEKREDQFVITEVSPRINDLTRPLAANVDQVVLIFSAKEPQFDQYLLDQFIALQEIANVNLKIIVTKIDLMSSDELKDLTKTLDYYKSIGYDYYLISNKTGEGLKEIVELFDNKISILSGQTGAGKSNSINNLIPGFTLKTAEISKALGRGKHTTRVSELYEFRNGLIGDTPGFSKLDFAILDYKDLKYYFKEFDLTGCRYQDCYHINEPGCKIKEKVDSGLINAKRYNDYVKFFNELKEMKRKY